ncbi:hypothetical protein GCM10010515_34570 [Streptomyces fructofermentans]|uniref:Uncharacterized protein n=1 Tax=Streptomyces fructofermentans TaxID=152141 RepID=A0A918KIG9_9ACTN|nr:hypothetical protein GCM10010515_34570 [Streptomyces fructofermentans]
MAARGADALRMIARPPIRQALRKPGHDARVPGSREIQYMATMYMATICAVVRRRTAGRGPAATTATPGAYGQRRKGLLRPAARALAHASGSCRSRAPAEARS